MTSTVVFFHAHPDDETLLTGGTMARLADEGHRVVLVTATLGDAGLSATSESVDGLAEVRRAELIRAASILGCRQVFDLGYADSGGDPSVAPPPDSFCAVPLDAAAHTLARILDNERADALTTYDAAGGYGHRDHVRVHHVGRRAADLAGTSAVFQATVDRQALQKALKATRLFAPDKDAFAARRFDALYSGREELTHRVDVRRYTNAKRAALASHRSQAVGGELERTVSWMLRLPKPLFRLAFGWEWFIEEGRPPHRPLASQLLA